MEIYQRGKVYAIICRKTDRQYVGSTCEPTLAKRLAQHVKEFKIWKKNKSRFVSSYDIIKNNDYYIILLELCSCNSKDELRMCEQKHINLRECVNICKAFITKEEKIMNKEKKQEYHKKYKEDNKYNEKRKIQYTCKCGATICKGGKARHERTQIHILNMAVLTDQNENK
jgi:Zn ribbon nucleic-acid-binding protein